MEKGARAVNWLGRIWVLAGLWMGMAAGAQEVEHLTTIHPGGFPGLPVLTGIFQESNGVRVTWDGPSGYYQLYEFLSLDGANGRRVGGPTLNRSMNVPSLDSNAFYRVTGPPSRFAGSAVCQECHASIHATESNTRHADALETLKSVGEETNPNCLPCHTVGFGLPSGFISEQATPHLAGVQCENCHGPGANHAANEQDLTVRPRRELAGQVCGGCHNGSKHPTFEEWSGSAHFAVVEDMNPSGRISNCGRCHSGSSRLALIHGEDPRVTVAHDANVGITCAVCHDPHGQHVWTNVLSGVVVTNQLRQAIASTNDFVLTTSDNFTNTYDPNINVCAQCHNHRGATWTATARAPHHSPQYNMMLGTVGELAPGGVAYRASHATLIEKQCVGCHMPMEDYQSEAQPALTGHSFNVERFDLCLSCHPFPEDLVHFTQTSISSQIQQIKGYLDLWATTQAPEALRLKYGALAWEYSSPGDLSEGSEGPTSSEQALIPDNIKKARFNLYLVAYDGSLGVHNGVNAVQLLDTAENWIRDELNQ